MMNLLIADDDPVMLKLYELNLSRAGYRVITCKTGEELHRLLKQEKPDAFILDYLLPDTTGLALTETIRKESAYQDLPIIVVTAQGKESIKQDLLKAGASMIFTKPFSPSVLLKCIQSLMEAKDQVLEEVNP